MASRREETDTFMLINIKGNVNRYYVQTLCMIFYPGARFSENAEDDGTPELTVEVFEEETVCRAVVTATLGDKTVTEEKSAEYSDKRTNERTVKIAVGAAVIAVLWFIERKRGALVPVQESGTEE